jgi:uncharacterized protein YebE (UPF0316 family)
MLLQVSFDYYQWVLLPLLIMVSRIFDVSLGTLRHVLNARGVKNLSPILGFFEVLIWIVVVKQVMNAADNWMCYIGWAGGFALGNYIGLIIEERLALGMQVMRIITSKDDTELIKALRKDNHGITVIDGEGANGPVKIIFSVMKRKNIMDAEKLIAQFHSDAFYSIEDVKESSHGVFTKKDKRMQILRQLFPERKK